jgi:membrane protease YdiL (CAAX protease family)
VITVRTAPFGVQQLRLGTFGLLFAGALAVIYGPACIARRRNLCPLIVVHGLWNPVAITRLYRM